MPDGPGYACSTALFLSHRHKDVEEIHIAICDNDSRLAAEPNGVVITSSGEARKLMMARALYKTPPSCHWTDPPAALDPVWEYEVYRRFSHISGGRTSV